MRNVLKKVNINSLLLFCMVVLIMVFAGNTTAIARTDMFAGGVVNDYFAYKVWGAQLPGGVHWQNADLLQTLKSNGHGWVRVGVTTVSSDLLKNTPQSQWGGLDWNSNNFWASLQYAEAILSDAGAKGMKKNLFFFLSDKAAHGSVQDAPLAWQGKTVEETGVLLKEYCYNTTKYFMDKGINIDIYEIGNEIERGILNFRPGERIYLPPGVDQLNDMTYMTNNVWNIESYLLTMAIQGVKQANPSAQIGLHIALLGASNNNILVKTFYQYMVSQAVPFDYIGLSYYGDPKATVSSAPYYVSSEMQNTISYLASLNKKIIFSEYAYPHDSTGTTLPNDSGYPYTPTGQAKWVKDFLSYYSNNSNILGAYYFYPEYFPGITLTPNLLESSGLFVNETVSQPALQQFVTPPSSVTNIAIGATALASTTYAGYSAAKINDGSNNTDISIATSWSNDAVAALPQWVQLDWGANKTFSRVELYTSAGYEIKDYQIQYWNGTSWVDCFPAVTGNTSVHRTHTFTAVTGSKIRVLGNSGPDIQPTIVRVNELEVYDDNIAIGATASASTTYAGYSAAKINDGSNNTDISPATSWSNDAVAALPQWVQLDWGTSKTFSRVELYTSAGYEIKDYQIQYWNGTSWVDCFPAVTGNTSVHRTHTFTAVTVSKIRVLGNSGPTIQPNIVRVNELEVYYDDNQAIGAPASASTTYAGYSAAKINDGSNNTDISPATSWSNDAVAALPQWVQLDLGTNKTFSRVELYTSAGYEIKDYQIQYWNGASWVDCFPAVTGNTSAHRTHTFTAVTGSKIRVLGNSGPTIQPNIVRVNELEVY